MGDGIPESKALFIFFYFFFQFSILECWVDFLGGFIFCSLSQLFTFSPMIKKCDK